MGSRKRYQRERRKALTEALVEAGLPASTITEAFISRVNVALQGRGYAVRDIPNPDRPRRWPTPPRSWL